MPKMVVAVIPNLDRCQDVLETWEHLGVTGITILESAGLHTLRQMRGRRDDLPLMPSLHHLLEAQEYHHRTAFAIVEDGFDVDALLSATEQAVCGDFNSPDSGLIFVMPVTHVLGLQPHWTQKPG
jgi:nitrogen regulatory protein PII